MRLVQRVEQAFGSELAGQQGIRFDASPGVANAAKAAPIRTRHGVDQTARFQGLALGL